MNKPIFLFFKYFCTSIVVAAIDYFIFWVTQYVTDMTITRVMVARGIALFIQYLLVNLKVFNNKLPTKRTLPFFLVLVIVNGILVSNAINLFNMQGVTKINSKVFAEIILFLPNYFICKEWIFKDGKMYP
ncbi:MAG: hypothetical protein NTZ74_12210 [Chloroflexi bacterium]|nr:hypothetical protein [Chloroflexota bacterium]